MRLKVSSPRETLFDNQIIKATIPTQNGDITVLSNHTPLVSTIRPGLLKIWSQNLPKKEKTFDFIGNDNFIYLSLSKGIFFIDGENISILVSSATYNPSKSLEELSTMQIDTEQKIIKLRQQGHIEEVEKKLIELQKIKADLALSYMKNK